MHIFDKDLTLNEIEPFILKGEVSDHWSINGIPNGGYLMALLAEAVMRYSDKKSTPIMTVNFMGKCVPGEVEISVKQISSTRQFSRFEAKLFQEGIERIHAIGTFAVEIFDCSMIHYEGKPPVVPPPGECLEIPEMPRYTLFGNVEVRLDPACAGWFQGKLADKSEHRGWIRFREGRTHDLASLFLMTDSFPPPVFATHGPAAWVPTLEMSVNVRNIPSSEWLKAVFRTRYINCGLLEEDGEVWDMDGELVAISRQIAQFRKLDS